MFTNITVNIWAPKDINLVGPSFKLNDVLDDEPEKLERLQYFVYIILCKTYSYNSAKYLTIQLRKY